MKKIQELESQAFEELKHYLESNPQPEPLQNYVQARFKEAGSEARERMKVMMELIRFQVYLNSLPEYEALKNYVEEVKAQLPMPKSRQYKKSA